MDIHEPTATVRESLRFSALLRQPKEVPLQEKYDYCEKIIDLLEMRSIAGATVGSAGSGLNQEQRKRLTIAVELASKPELLLFLDEPTSGLDSLAAFNIVRFLRRLTDAGQAVLCTIHQPSAVLFEHFDDLVLLQSGGQAVYNGPLGNDSKTLIEFFERNGGRRCSPHENPAEVYLCLVLVSSEMLMSYSICWKSLALAIPTMMDRIGPKCGPIPQSQSSSRKISKMLSAHAGTLKMRRSMMTGSTPCRYGPKSPELQSGALFHIGDQGTISL